MGQGTDDAVSRQTSSRAASQDGMGRQLPNVDEVASLRAGPAWMNKLFGRGEERPRAIEKVSVMSRPDAAERVGSARKDVVTHAVEAVGRVPMTPAVATRPMTPDELSRADNVCDATRHFTDQDPLSTDLCSISRSHLHSAPMAINGEKVPANLSPVRDALMRAGSTLLDLSPVPAAAPCAAPSKYNALMRKGLEAGCSSAEIAADTTPQRKVSLLRLKSAIRSELLATRVERTVDHLADETKKVGMWREERGEVLAKMYERHRIENNAMRAFNAYQEQECNKVEAAIERDADDFASVRHADPMRV